MSSLLWPRGGIEQSGLNIFPAKKGAHREIDLREELRLILEGSNYSPQRGHWVLLRRMDTAQRCTCWNERGHGDEKYNIDERKYDEPDENCPVCNGEGWLYEEELHLTRKTIVSPDLGLSRQEQIAPVGIMNVYNIAYYFQYYVNPSKKDKIIEIENSSEGKPERPYEYRKIHNISTCDALRDQKGRVEFWKCSVKQEVI